MADRLTPSGERGEWTLAALAAIIGITAAWWALALWPASAETPAWVLRTRYACFGATATGLPNGGGWLLLIGQPLGMVGMLLVVWGRPLRAGLLAASRSWAGRLLLGVLGLVIVAGTAGAVVRVSMGGLAADADAPALDAATFGRLDRVAPPLVLVDQRGDTVSLARFAGRSVLVTFAYAHCETVCPLLVREVLNARRTGSGPRPAVLIVTLDPWRDTPARLPAIAERWKLRDDERVLSGSVAAVEATLDAWAVGRGRDPRTGEIAHPALAYVVGPDGRLAFLVPADRGALLGLLQRL